MKLGDTITLGGVPLVFLPQTVGEREELEKKRQAERPAAMWPSFLWLTVFQVLTCRAADRGGGGGGRSGRFPAGLPGADACACGSTLPYCG